MSHADTLRGMASDEHILAGRENPRSTALLAGAEALGEVIRLRKAIAELAEEERATAEDDFFPVHLRDLCRAYADDLARILEGDTDE